jgi:microcystin-dependent protein
MKKYFNILAALTLCANMFAQSPEKISFQAVIRDAENNLVTDAQIGIQISILQGSENGSVVYSGTQLITSNSNGLVSIEIGAGTSSGDISSIEWANGPYFIKTEIDPTGGTNYTITGTSRLMSVPFALHAKTADTFLGSIEESDPVFGVSVAGAITAEDITAWNNKLDSYEEMDPVYDASVARGITQADTALWNTNVDETDPVFGASVAMGITETDTTLWNNKMDVDLNAGANELMTFDGTNWVAKGAKVYNSGGSLAQNNMQPWIAVNYIIALDGTFPSRSSTNPLIAEIIMFGGNFAPRGWALCNGQILPIAPNSALFSLLGTTYGGDGRTTLALPDMRGRTVIHPGTGPGLSSRRLGAKGGSETNVMTVTQMPSHNHIIYYE